MRHSHVLALSMLQWNRDRDLGPAITSPYVLGDEKAPPPHVRTSKWLEMAAGHQRKLVPIRQVRSRPRAEPAFAGHTGVLAGGFREQLPKFRGCPSLPACA